MQKTATKIFIGASIVFGIVGIIMVLTIPPNDAMMSGFGIVIRKILMMSGFVILTSFALAVASKYLSNK